MFTYDEFLQQVQIKKETFKRIDLSGLLLDDELKQFDLYDKVVFCNSYYDECDRFEETLALEKNEKWFSLTYNKTVDYGESGAEVNNKNESR